MKLCRACGEPLIEKPTRHCRNGCSIYTAQPVGVEVSTRSAAGEPPTYGTAIKRPQPKGREG